MSRCRSCDAPVLWARTVTGKLIPLDTEPSDGGNLVLDDGRALIYDHTTSNEMFAPPLYVSHFATCPQADRWRRRESAAR